MFEHIPMFHVVCQFVFCILAILFMVYDIALLMATYAYRNDQNIPFAYLIVMNVCGVLCKIAFITDFATYLALPYYEYLCEFYYKFEIILHTDQSAMRKGRSQRR